MCICRCGSAKSYRKFAVAKLLLQFCGICGCGIEFKFAVPSFAYMQHRVTSGRDPICNMKLPRVGTSDGIQGVRANPFLFSVIDLRRPQQMGFLK